MARNELSKDAMKIADLIYKKASEKTNKEIAEKIGIDPSNLGRFQTNYLEMVCAYLDEIGLSVHVYSVLIGKIGLALFYQFNKSKCENFISQIAQFSFANCSIRNSKWIHFS
ncbi:hypothetical protein [Aggregatibacter actinomycetemcomitans]|uniref:hypothetical protein n=1 Tax=Aggregatibacter actinomycetemcomitans TaxID=714 RepID=UPI000437570C|nr:hypothetical protein [Aggregatibacter actinomycetemcomitans]AHN72154.1 hypothetical protein CF65_01909 [Aggregatibacter actinomycetemcomitans HK1651]